MNQHQRKFLLEQIEQQYKKERAALIERRPKAPSLNNYLIAAVLDGTAQLKSHETVSKAVRERVRDLGKGDAFVGPSSRSWHNREDESEDMVSIPALLLFDEPPAYADARAKYDEALAAWRREAELLESSINAMRIKVQVGSNEALATLVNQADQLCSMSLTTSSRLLLPNAAQE